MKTKIVLLFTFCILLAAILPASAEFEKYSTTDFEPAMINGQEGFICRYQYHGMIKVTEEVWHPVLEKYMVLTARYEDQNGNPVEHESGYYSHTNEISEDGKTCLQTFLDINGDPVMIDGGYAAYYSLKSEQQEEFIFLDEDLLPIETDQGYSRQILTKDPENMTKTVRYFDLNGDPVTVYPGGYTSFTEYYNNCGYYMYTEYYDINGNLVNRLISY